MLRSTENAEVVSLYHYGPETLILEKVDDVVTATLEPVHVFNVDEGTAYTGIQHSASYLGLHPSTIRRYIDKGALRTRRLPSGVRRIGVDSLKDLRNQMQPSINDMTLEPEAKIGEPAFARDRISLDPHPATGLEQTTGQPIHLSLGMVGGAKTIEIKEVPLVESPPEGYIGIPIHGLEAATRDDTDGLVVWIRVPEQLLATRHETVIGNTLPGVKMDFLDGSVSIDFDKREVVLDGGTKYLPKKTFSVLRYLVENKGLVLSRNQILNEVWGDWFGSRNIIDINVSAIRKSLGSYRFLIKTKHGYGYMFDDTMPSQDLE